MPLWKKIQFRDSVWVSLWKIKEEADYFLEKNIWTEEEKREFSGLKGHRLREWLAVRHLARLELGEDAFISKDKIGRPLLGESDITISLSHSRNIAAFAWSSKGILGIDVQWITDKIFRIAHKFARPEEADYGDFAQLHLVWGAKEAMFKAYGSRGIDFLKNLKVEGGAIHSNEGVRRGYLEKDGLNIHFELEYRIEGDYILVLALSDFIRL